MCDDWTTFEFCTLDNVPHISGVYFLMNDDELVYIGQSNNIHNRILSHKQIFNCDTFLGKEPLYPDMFNSLYYFECDYKPERKEYESFFIEDYFPKLNGVDLIIGERMMLDKRMKVMIKPCR
jgi:excinuclease UvrABC nuclease subunit